MADAAIARVPRRPRVRPADGRTIPPPNWLTTACQVMAWAGGYLMFDDPRAGADLYIRQAELAVNPALTVVRARQLILTLRDGAQAMPQGTRRGRALRRLLDSAADTISAEVTR